MKGYKLVSKFDANQEIIERLQDLIISWFYLNGRKFPWRETSDPFKVLIAEILLHQTFADKVVPVFLQITSLYPNSLSLSKADVARVREIIMPLGLLYRANTLISLAKEIVEKYNGNVPNDLRGLLTLPGVGDYTAHAVFCFAYGQAVPVVDRNVIRVYKRLFSIPEPLNKINPTKEFFLSASKIVPCDHAIEYNWGLLDFAAIICKHYSPDCYICPAIKICRSPEKSEVFS